MEPTPLLRSYGLATRLVAPFTHIWVRRRAAKGKEDPARLSERHGIASQARPEGPLIWMHGASLGETQMLMPVLRRILNTEPNIRALITSQTTTSAELLARQLPPRAIHQYAPLDYPKAVQKFLDHWRPDVAVFGESEIWPNLIRKTHNTGIPMALLNARMSPKSLEGWHKRQNLAKKLFAAFKLIIAADTQTADGLSWLLGRDIESAGNLKDAAPPLPVNAFDLKTVQSETSNRPIWCAASTHPGEDAIIIKAHKTILQRFNHALLILAPRHPSRAREIEAMLADAGLRFVSRSSDLAVSRDSQVYVFDTIGEM